MKCCQTSLQYSIYCINVMEAVGIFQTTALLQKPLGCPMRSMDFRESLLVAANFVYPAVAKWTTPRRLGWVVYGVTCHCLPAVHTVLMLSI